MVDVFSDKDFLLMTLISQTRNAMMKARQKELAAYDISPWQAGILMIVQATKGRVSFYKIARWDILERHSISEIIRRMEKRGLVKRVNTTDRKKSVKIKLTKKGREFCEVVAKCETYHKIMSSISPEQHDRVREGLKILRDAALREIGIHSRLPFPPF